jgi:hypothetical protein
MPRSRQSEALHALDMAVAAVDGASRALVTARRNLEKCQVRAVKAGVTRYEVAEVCGVSHQRIGQVPGMPKGKNVVKSDVDGRRR